MEGGALSDKSFAEFAKEYVLFCHVTSRVSTDKDQELLSEKGGRGFPHLIMMDETGDVIAVHNGARSVEGFAQTGTSARKYLGLRDKAKAGDEAAKAEFLLLRMELGLVGYADAETEAEGVKLSPEQQKRFDGLMLDLEVKLMFESLRNEADPQAKVKELGKMWLAKIKEGKTPVNDESFLIFHGFVLQYCDEAKDLESFRLAVGNMEKRFGADDNPQYTQMLTQLRNRLKEMEAEAGGE